MVVFCNRDNTHNCIKILYGSRKVVFNVPKIFVDVGLRNALRGNVNIVGYMNYVLHVAESNPNARVLAIVPDTWGDYPRNVWLATEFYIKLRRRRKQIPRNLTLFIVVHGGLIDTYWMQYKVLFYNYNMLVSTGFAIPSRKMDLSETVIECGRKPLQCAAAIRAFIARARQELGNNVLTHLLGAGKRLLTALGDDLRFVYSFDSDAYRLVPNDKLRKEDLGDGRFMISTAVDARKWANEWLGEIAKYVTQ